MENKENLIERISSLINDCVGYTDSIEANMRIEEDLGITGDDAVEFIIAYGELFNVDVSNFMAADYFKPEGLDSIGAILECLNLKKKKVKKVLTISDLLKGIGAGYLDDRILSNHL